jgi:hypothetical protein
LASNKFTTQHYNAIAKDVRDELTDAMAFYSPSSMEALSTLVANDRRYYAVDSLIKLALRFARRFADDYELFDPLKFLDACSPNVDMYPLSELWDADTRKS